MVPKVREQAAALLNRFGLPKVVTADGLPASISDGSLIASLLSRYYPDQIDISQLILPTSSLHSKMHNWTVVNDCLASTLDNGEILSLASANGDTDAIERLMEQLRRILPEGDASRSTSPILEPNSSSTVNLSISSQTRASPAIAELLSNAIETCEETVRYLNDRAERMTIVLRQLRTTRDGVETGNQFDRLLSNGDRDRRRLKTVKTSKSVEGIALKSGKKAGNRPNLTKSKNKTTKPTKRATPRLKRKAERSAKETLSATEDRILSLKERFDSLLKEQSEMT